MADVVMARVAAILVVMVVQYMVHSDEKGTYNDECHGKTHNIKKQLFRPYHWKVQEWVRVELFIQNNSTEKDVRDVQQWPWDRPERVRPP